MEHRMAHRCSVDFPARVYIPEHGVVSGRLLDISVDGAYFSGVIPACDVTTRILLVVSVPGDSRSCGFVPAHVVRRAPEGLGVLFEEDSDTAHELVAQLLSRAMRKPSRIDLSRSPASDAV